MTRHPGSLPWLWAKDGTLGDKEEQRVESEGETQGVPEGLKLSSAALGGWGRLHSVPGIWWLEVIDLWCSGLSVVEGKTAGSQGFEE